MAVHLTSSGLSMPASQSASGDANTLDDYEEGTFTPVMSSGGNKTGVYTKIGRKCHCVIQMGDINAGSSNSSQHITGLPFTAASAPGGFAITYLIRVAGHSADLHWRVNAGNTTMTGHWYDGTGVGSDTIQNQWTTGGSSIYLAGSYLI